MNLILQVVGTILSLVGVSLNIFKKRACWIFFFVANCFWIWLYLRINFIPVVFLMCVYQILAVCGWFKWKKNQYPVVGDREVTDHT